MECSVEAGESQPNSTTAKYKASSVVQRLVWTAPYACLIGGVLLHHRVEPWGWNRYDVANPVIDCPDGNKPQRIGGDGDGGKFLCLEGILSEPGCLVYSLGSAGQFEFEQAMLEASCLCPECG